VHRKKGEFNPLFVKKQQSVLQRRKFRKTEELKKLFSAVSSKGRKPPHSEVKLSQTKERRLIEGITGPCVNRQGKSFSIRVSGEITEPGKTAMPGGGKKGRLVSKKEKKNHPHETR